MLDSTTEAETNIAMEEQNNNAPSSEAQDIPHSNNTLEGAPSNADQTSNTTTTTTTTDQTWLQVGRMVKVQSRTWPGINCPGGQGHIEKVYKSTTNTNLITHVDVKYLSCEAKTRDRGIEIQYVTDYNMVTLQIADGEVGARSSRSRRNRQTSVNSRRCTNCGAFAIDCGNCDWILAEQNRINAIKEQKEREERDRYIELMKQRQREEMSGLEDTSSSEGSSDESEIDSEEEERRKVRKYMKRRRKFGRGIKKQRQRMAGRGVGVGGDSSSDEDSEDEIPLSELEQRKWKRDRKRRERKLRKLQMMIDNKQDNQLKKKGKVRSTKNKKKRSRTRPENLESLATLSAVGKGDADKQKDRSNEGKKKRKKTNPEPKKVGKVKEVTEKSNDIGSKPEGAINNADESGSSSDEDVPLANLKQQSQTAMDVDMPDNSEQHDTINGDQDVTFTATFDDEVSDDQEEQREDEVLLTPREEMSENSNNNNEDDDSLLTPTADFDSDDYFSSDDDADDTLTEDIVMDIKWCNLPKFVSDLEANIEDTRIPNIQGELSTLKRRFAAAKKRSSSIDFEHIDEKGQELNRRVIQELHRSGVDLLNKALKRLLSKRERSDNEPSLTESQKKLCRKTNVRLLDMNVANLHTAVRDIDNKVTSFQKEVWKELQLADESHYQFDTRNSSDAFGETASLSGEVQSRKKKRKSVTKDYDLHHPHASRKRKSSIESSHSTQRQQSGQAGVSRSKSNKGRKAQTNQHIEEKEDEDNDMSTDNFDFGGSNFDIDFIGDTDDIDDNGRSVLPSGGASRGGQRQQNHTNTTASRSREGSANYSSRQSRPMANQMEAWLDKQGSDGEVEPEPVVKRRQSTIRNSFNRQASSANSSGQSRQTSSARTSGLSAHGMQWVQSVGSSRSSQSRVRTGSSSQSNNNPRGQGSAAASRQKNNSSRSGQIRGGEIDELESSIRPTIPRALSQDLLFDSISKDRNIDEEEHHVHWDDSKSLSELCKDLQDSHPTNIQACRNSLISLTKVIQSKENDHLDKDEVIRLFQILLSVLQRKCTTLLDIIQTNPEVASLQIDCWCLIFRMLEKRLNGKLGQDDGVLYKIFGKQSLLAKHILIQILDVFYSQLLWEEYGQTPSFHNRVFDQLRLLCIRIGRIVPLLPTVCGILMSKFTKARWYKSLTIEHKENELEKVLFVSAVDPLMHKRFLSAGDAMPEPDKGDIRLKSFKQRIPREEIEAVWSFIGFSSCCTNTTQSKPDIKNVELLLSALLFYDCGTLSSSQIHEKLPPSKLQVDTCSKEIKWICSLLSSKLLGDVPKMDKLDKQVIQRVVRLEAFDQVIDLIPSSSTTKVNKTVKQLWGYSCITESSTKLESNLQSSLMNLDISCLTNNTNDVYSLLSNSVLLRECVSFTAIYANMVMKKNPVWNGFRTNKLCPLIEMFVKEAIAIEADLEQNRSGENSSVDDEFAAMFRCIELATEIRIVESPASSHYREAACHLLLATVLSRSKNNSPGKGFNLNKSFIEKIMEYSSDDKMRRHQKYHLDSVTGNVQAQYEPPSPNNICLLYTSSKTLAYTSLMHLYVTDFNSDNHESTTKQLCEHLSAVKADIDTQSLTCLLISIMSNLRATSSLLDNLNQRTRLAEDESSCMAHLNSSKTCINAIRSMAMWINLILGRARFIIKLINNVNSPDAKLLQLAEAIKKLGCSSFFHFVVQSFTTALTSIVDTSSKNLFSKALMIDGCLEQSFRSCLGAIRSSTKLVNVCGTTGSLQQWNAAGTVYTSFVSSNNTSSLSVISQGEQQKLCHGQSGGVLSVLAALCSIKSAQNMYIYDLFKPQPTHNADQRYTLHQMAVCFSSELVRLAVHDYSCKSLATQHLQKLLGHLMTALLDCDTLAMFPTSNLSLLSKLDTTHSSRSKGNDVLSKVQIHTTVGNDPDLEAYKVKRMGGDYFDTAGPSFNCKNIWSFCESVGHLLIEYNDPMYSLQTPMVQSIGSEIISFSQKLRSDKDLLELLPQISLERECLKRLLFFQELFMVLKQDKDKRLDVILGNDGGLFGTLATSLIENLYYLSGIAVGLEEQQKIGCVDPYQRAKSLAFQRAYTELSGSLMNLMLRENTSWEDTSTCKFMQSNIIAPIFRGNLQIRRSIEMSAVNLSLNLRKRSSKDGSSRLAEDMYASLIRRSNDLLVYADDGFKSTLFDSMLHGLTSKDTDTVDSFLHIMSRRLVLASQVSGFYNSNTSSDGLQRAVDNHFLCTELIDGDETSEHQSLLRLRNWIMTKFVALLNGCSITTPLRILTARFLSFIISTFSFGDVSSGHKICDQDGNLMSLLTCTKLFRSFKECLCNSIRSGTADDVLVVALFSCAKQFLGLSISGIVMDDSTETDSHTLLSLAHVCNQGLNLQDKISPCDSQALSYICEVSSWLNVCGGLLKSEHISALHGFLIRIEDKVGDTYQLEADESMLQQLCSSFNKVNSMERELSLVNTYTNVQRSTNPYAKKAPVQVGSQDLHALSRDSLKSIADFSGFLQSISSA